MENWRAQIRKGYLEMCILLVVRAKHEVYGFELLEEFSQLALNITEGTIYPLLNRMHEDALLNSHWRLDAQERGHPRKFYKLTVKGKLTLATMIEEFRQMTVTFEQFVAIDPQKEGGSDGHGSKV